MAHAYLVAELADTAAGELVTVGGDEARHAVKVARLQVGEQIELLNGHGMRAVCETVAVSPSTFEVRVLEVVREPEPTPRIHLVQALAKGGRDEMAVQAAVELGVSSVTPWQAHRSVSQWRGEKIARQRDRWTSISREAAKQSLSAWLPAVEDFAASVPQLMQRLSAAQVIVLDPRAETRLSEVDCVADDIVLVVGPEGGIESREFDEFTQLGAQRIRLGAEVLRTSTAGPAAIAVLQCKLGRW